MEQATYIPIQAERVGALMYKLQILRTIADKMKGLNKEDHESMIWLAKLYDIVDQTPFNENN